MKSQCRYFVISCLALAADQLAKFGAIKIFSGGQSAKLGWGFGLTFYLNEQFAWSWPLSNAAAIVLSLGLLALGSFFYFRCARARPELSALFLIASGALSNLIDRIARGGVVDYISVPAGGVINLADIFIFVGVGLLITRMKTSP